MLMVITGVGFLIHVYSVGHMVEDRGIARFFTYMNLFIFSMLVLVLAADLLILIIGWALVALSSYLLIGFWYERPSAVIAARKAFVTQVIGDVALVIAAFMIVLKVGTLSIPGIFAGAGSFPPAACRSPAPARSWPSVPSPGARSSPFTPGFPTRWRARRRSQR